MKLAFDRSSWKSVSFGNVVKKVTNIINPADYHSNIVVEGGNIKKRDIHIREYANKNELGYLGPAFHMGFKKGQILYVSRNPHLMKVGYPDFDGICSNTTFIMETHDENVLRNDLIPFIMHSDTFIEQSVGNVRGGVNPYVNWGDLACINFLLPPKEQQAEIAKLIWAMDDVIQKKINLLESLETFKEVKFNNLVKMADGEMKPLSDFIFLKKEKSKNPHKFNKYIGLEHIESGEFKCEKFGNSSEMLAQCNIVKTGDLCYSKLRPNLDKAFIASFNAVATTELLIYNTLGVSKDYILHHLHSKDFVSYASGQGFGTKMPRVSTEIIGNYKIKKVMEEDLIVKKMGMILENINYTKIQIKTSKNLLKSLINDIFSHAF